MTAKEFLSQAYLLDQSINSKLEQVKTLRCLAEKATSILSPASYRGTRNLHQMEEVIAKMLDLEAEISADINALIDTKREVMDVVQRMSTKEYRTLLELRYICGKPWPEIARELKYGNRYIHTVHSAALQELDAVKSAKMHNL